MTIDSIACFKGGAVFAILYGVEGNERYEAEAAVYHWTDQSRQAAGDVAADEMDLSICQTLLVCYDLLYGAGICQYRNIPFDHSGISKSGGYHHRI